MDLFHLLILTDGLWCFYQTLILTAPICIHCWDTSTNLMTHPNLRDHPHLQHIFIWHCLRWILTVLLFLECKYLYKEASLCVCCWCPGRLLLLEDSSHTPGVAREGRAAAASAPEACVCPHTRRDLSHSTGTHFISAASLQGTDAD